MPLRSSSRKRALKLSIYPFSHGLPGAMYAVLGTGVDFVDANGGGEGVRLKKLSG